MRILKKFLPTLRFMEYQAVFAEAKATLAEKKKELDARKEEERKAQEPIKLKASRSQLTLNS